MKPELVALSLVVGCSADARQCLTGVDCVSGQCRANGTCVVLADGGAAIDATQHVDATVLADGSALDAAIGCVPNGDGILTREEMPTPIGGQTRYHIAHMARINTAGSTTPDGRTWDFSQLPGQTRAIVLAEPSDFWFAAHFPNATYVTELAGVDEFAVFRATASELLLIGIASAQPGALATNLAYNPPVPVMKFPAAQGTAWTVSATVSGLWLGVPTVYTERYDYEYDAVGKVETGIGNFAAWRLRHRLVRTAGGVFTRRGFSFIAECIGIVASMASGYGEPAVEFTSADEVRSVSL